MGSRETADYLNGIATDPQAREAHHADPDGAMTAAGLDDTDREVLKSKDPDRIREHMGDDGPPGCYICIL